MTKAEADDCTVVRRALLSVFDKQGLVELAQALRAHGAELVASGGTARTLREAGLAVTAVEDYTGAPEVLDGRVKTLHPRVAAGILADRRVPAHLADLAAHGYAPIDLVVCNLYPFARTVAAGKSPAEVTEMIDIGGPTLIRAAAKNHAGGVAVVADPADYPAVLAALRKDGIPAALRRQLAGRAFQITAQYDAEIAAWFARPGVEAGASAKVDATGGSGEHAEQALGAPERMGDFVRQAALRYGENPHQRAYLFQEAGTTCGVAYAARLSGKELSYNNYLDLDAAYRAVHPFAEPACAIIKHTNPCGLAAAATQEDSFSRALAADPVAAFGSVVGLNRPLSAATAERILAAELFVECIIAPDFTAAARELLRHKTNLRLVAAPPGSPLPSSQLHRIGGGLLWQECDPGVGDPRDWKVVSRRPLAPGWLDELRFAMHAACALRSNAIAVTGERTLLGAGTGQMSRIEAAQIALRKAGERARGGFLGSDAFFPFPDCVEAAAAAGIVAIVQPGGSLRDADSITACDRHSLAMVFTGRRHFRH